jgi:ribonucleotide reductase alpha subunit
MKLPINHEDAINEWNRFEDYLVRERYAIRNPKSGKPEEKNLTEVLKRISREFSFPGIAGALLNMQFITATPFLMNGGNPHTQRKGYYSCYPLGNVEDSTEAIFDMERDLVTIFQHSGGGGIDVSNIRPKGSPVDNGQGTASGPVSFAKGYSHLSARISQGGKRRGALMIQADWDIQDIKELISFKGNNPGIYTGCNVSVNVTSDAFWDDEELIQMIAEYIWKSGDPGLLFTQKSMENTPVPQKYNPVFSNPCGEYLSTKDTACNLLTVNLQKCLVEKFADFLTNVYENARLAAIGGNEILDMGGFPPMFPMRMNMKRPNLPRQPNWHSCSDQCRAVWIMPTSTKRKLAKRLRSENGILTMPEELPKRQRNSPVNSRERLPGRNISKEYLIR